MPTDKANNILVVGAGGMLGGMLLKVLGTSRTADGVDIGECDISSSEAVARTLDLFRPAWVVNAAAYTDVDGCETHPEAAARVNGDGPGILASACRERGMGLVHIGTDFVFDGRGRRPYREDDPPAPINEYGRSKLAGEVAVAAAGGEWIVVRTSWLFGPGGRNFPATIWAAACSRPEIAVVSDQVGSPTSTADLSEAVAALIDGGGRGIYHFCGSGECSWYEYARYLLGLAGSETRVSPISSAASGRPAVRPAYSVMDCRKFCAFTGRKIRPWREMVKDYWLRELCPESAVKQEEDTDA